MTWNAPMTAYTNSSFSAAEYNKYIRDNLNQMAPAKATASGDYFVTYPGPNSIKKRTTGSATVTTPESTTSTSYTNLTTVGPSVTVGTGKEAMVFFSAQVSNTTSGAAAFCSVSVSSGSSYPASDVWSFSIDGLGNGTGSQSNRGFTFHKFTNLKPGNNTFTMKYRAGSGTANFSQRRLVVFPL